MNDTLFWAMIESAWESVGGSSKARQMLTAGKLSRDMAEELQEHLEDVNPALNEQLGLLPAADLMAFDRILERKLYDLDREDIQEYTDGSDDGFLYARGFIVAVGRDYYEAVVANPSTALIDLECEEMCYLSWHLYKEKFGELLQSEIFRETCSNKAGWPDLRK